MRLANKCIDYKLLKSINQFYSKYQRFEPINDSVAQGIDKELKNYQIYLNAKYQGKCLKNLYLIVEIFKIKNNQSALNFTQIDT